jgi:hypothetical protein
VEAGGGEEEIELGAPELRGGGGAGGQRGGGAVPWCRDAVVPRCRRLPPGELVTVPAARERR